MFLAAMLRTGDENHELPLLLGLPLSPILCYFSSACLPGEEGGGGEISFAQQTFVLELDEN